MEWFKRHVWEVIRVLLGAVYLWAFIDKTFGLGFATAKENAWVLGGSPTYGYLMHGTKGPFAEYFQMLAGSMLVEWLFMLGILFVGVSLILGVAVRLGALAGMAFYILFYISGFMPPEHNPVIDEHVINFVLMLGIFAFVPNAGWWQKSAFVRRWPFLR